MVPMRTPARSMPMFRSSVDRIFERTSGPEEAVDRFDDKRETLHPLLEDISWEDIEDGKCAFSESPKVLIYLT